MKTGIDGQEAVRTSLANLVALQRHPDTVAARPDTKTGSDRALINERVIPALDRLLALLAMREGAGVGQDEEATEAGVRDILRVLNDATEALYGEDAKQAVQILVELLGESA